MKKSVLIGIFIVGVLGTIFYIYNYQTTQQEVSLGSIFSGEEGYLSDVEYEYVGADGKTVTKTTPQLKETPAQKIPQQIVQNAEKSVETIVEKTQTATATVQEAAQTVVEQPPILKANVSKSAFTIQVASLKDKAGAERIVKELNAKNYSGFIVPRELGDKGTWYRVYVGQFNAKSEADDFLAKVQQDFPGSFVIAPKK